MADSPYFQTNPFLRHLRMLPVRMRAAAFCETNPFAGGGRRPRAGMRAAAFCETNPFLGDLGDLCGWLRAGVLRNEPICHPLGPSCLVPCCSLAKRTHFRWITS